MATFFVAQISIEDPERYKQYLQGYDEVFSRFHGRVVAVDDAVSLLEGEWPHGRTVLIEFPSEQHLRAWYESPAYQALAVHRRSAATANIVVVHGRE